MNWLLITSQTSTICEVDVKVEPFFRDKCVKCFVRTLRVETNAETLDTLPRQVCSARDYSATPLMVEALEKKRDFVRAERR